MEFPSKNEIFQTILQLADRFEKDKKVARLRRKQTKKDAINQRRATRRPSIDKNFQLAGFVSADKIQQYWEYITVHTDIYQRAVNAVDTIYSRYDFEFKSPNEGGNTLKKLLDDPMFKTAVRQLLLEIVVDLYLFGYSVLRFPADPDKWLEDAAADKLLKQHTADATDIYQSDILNERTLPRDLLSNTAMALPFGRIPIYAGDYYHHVNKNSAVQVYTFFPKLPEAKVLEDKFRTVVFVRPSSRPQMYDISTGLLLCYQSWVRFRIELKNYQGATAHIQRPLVLMEERLTKNDSQQTVAAEVAPYMASILNPKAKETAAGRNRQALQIRHKLASPDAAGIMRVYLIDVHNMEPHDDPGRPVDGSITGVVQEAFNRPMRKTRPDSLAEINPHVLNRMEYDAVDLNKTQADEMVKHMASAPIGFDVHSYHAPQPQEAAVRLLYELYERDLKRLFSGLDLSAGDTSGKDIRLPSDRTGVKNLRLAKMEEQQRDLRVLRMTKEYFTQIYSESGAEFDQIELVETMEKIRELLDAGKLTQVAKNYIAEEVEERSISAEDVLSDLLNQKPKTSQGKKASTAASLIDLTVSYYEDFSAIKRNIALLQRILITLQRAILTPGNRLELTATPTQAEQKLLGELTEMDGDGPNGGGGRDAGNGSKELTDFLTILSDTRKNLGNETVIDLLRKYESKATPAPKPKPSAESVI